MELKIECDKHNTELDGEIDRNRNLSITTCPDCIKEAKEEAHKEGYDEGYEDGVHEGE